MHNEPSTEGVGDKGWHELNVWMTKTWQVRGKNAQGNGF